MKTIGAAKFKEQCLALIDRVGAEEIVITKRGRPVARLVAYGREPAELIGCLAGRIDVRGDLLSTGLRWNASER